MEPTQNGTEILSEPMCWERLRRTSVGRIAVLHEGQPAIYPINFLVEGSSILFRTRPDSKIAHAPLLERVAFEIDGFDSSNRSAWSVLIKGFGRFVDSVPELEEIESLPLYPWVDADRSAWVRITPVEVTGRRFHLIDDALSDGSIGWVDQVDSSHGTSAV